LSRTAKPLYARIKKECIGNWEWGDKEQQGFNKLRTKLTTAPGLVNFNPLAPTKIETDNSNTSAAVYYHNTASRGNGSQWYTDPGQCRTPNATMIYTTTNDEQ